MRQDLVSECGQFRSRHAQRSPCGLRGPEHRVDAVVEPALVDARGGVVAAVDSDRVLGSACGDPEADQGLSQPRPDLAAYGGFIGLQPERGQRMAVGGEDAGLGVDERPVEIEENYGLVHACEDRASDVRDGCRSGRPWHDHDPALPLKPSAAGLF